MIKTFVKHQIYDYCIHIFFNNIVSNFHKKSSTGIPVVGGFYSKVLHKYDDETYFNCIVTNIEQRKNSKHKDYLIITIKYDYCEGGIFDNDNVMEAEMERNFQALIDEGEIDEEALGGNYEEVYKEWMDNNEIYGAQYGGGMSLNYNFFYFYE
jgi:hypothetical protein